LKEFETFTIKEISGIHQSQFMLSPEAIKAQLMAELKDLAEYRKRHLQAVMDWSDPVKRSEMEFAGVKYKDIKVKEEESREELKKAFKDEDPEVAYAKFAVRSDKSPLHLRLIPVVPSKTRWQRFIAWITKSIQRLR
jgi:hypothetical protein